MLHKLDLLQDLRKHGERIITSHSYLPEVRTKEHYLQDVGEHQDRADHLQRKLVDLQRDCVAAVRAAEAATGRRPTPPGSPRSSGSGDEAAGSAHIRLAVQALLEKLCSFLNEHLHVVEAPAKHMPAGMGS